MYAFFEKEAIRNWLITLISLVLLVVMAPRVFNRPHAEHAQSPVSQLEDRRAIEQQWIDSIS